MTRSDGSLDPTITPSQAGATLEDTARESMPTQPAGPPRLAAPGYDLGPLLGQGGMGEVVLAEDRRIGRSVALKRMRGADHSDESRARFLREAKIQARLDHPAIVPVHELGYDDDNLPFFTMKRLTGTTLADVMRDPAATQTRMLRAFVDVCFAVAFAHERAVIHRDLKPSNIMLGDYGEVYVLDWGVARVIGERDTAGQHADIHTLDGQTQAGAVLGTPGYMAPEQVAGDLELHTPADVYALGSILFEILTREALHPRGTAALAMTIAQPCQAPTARSPDRSIAPELDALCVAALAQAPAERPTAKQLGDRVQQYLDGDRDLERRRLLAADYLARARAAIANNDPHRRAEVMRLAGRALALDPESGDAAALVTSLMLEPPKTMPAALQKRLYDADSELIRRQGKRAALAIASYLVFLPFALILGVKDWAFLAGIYGCVTVLGVFAWWTSTRAGRNMMFVLVGNIILMMMFSRILSPLIIVPGLAGVVMMAMVSFPDSIDRPHIVIAGMVSSIVMPIVFEWLGWWQQTWHLEDGRFVAESALFDMRGAWGYVFVVAANVAMLVVAGAFARSLSAARRDMSKQLEIQAWHLGQLLPVEAPRPQTTGSLLGC